MGVFAEIEVPCPQCETIHLAQSKGGDSVGYFNLGNVPQDILEDVNRHAPFLCNVCHTSFKVILLPFVVKA